MTANSKRVTKGLLDRLLKAQTRRSEREKRMPFGEKLKIVDQLVAEHESPQRKVSCLMNESTSLKVPWQPNESRKLIVPQTRNESLSSIVPSSMNESEISKVPKQTNESH
jgi:hypothetical protein